MPQDAGRDGAPGTPAVRDAADPLETRRRSHPLYLAKRSDEREVAVRPDVGAAERHQEIDVCGPGADTVELDQCGVCVVVAHI
jgi:hypothetical protein